jgi:hypothetical protein
MVGDDSRRIPLFTSVSTTLPKRLRINRFRRGLLRRAGAETNAATTAMGFGRAVLARMGSGWVASWLKCWGNQSTSLALRTSPDAMESLDQTWQGASWC